MPREALMKDVTFVYRVSKVTVKFTHTTVYLEGSEFFLRVSFLKGSIFKFTESLSPTKLHSKLVRPRTIFQKGAKPRAEKERERETGVIRSACFRRRRTHPACRPTRGGGNLTEWQPRPITYAAQRAP